LTLKTRPRAAVALMASLRLSAFWLLSPQRPLILAFFLGAPPVFPFDPPFRNSVFERWHMAQYLLKILKIILILRFSGCFYSSFGSSHDQIRFGF
jgi:hypothetical protein